MAGIGGRGSAQEEWKESCRFQYCPGIGLGPVAGAAMNPAADFMPRWRAGFITWHYMYSALYSRYITHHNFPRLVSYLAGNQAAFSHSGHFWLLPFLLPHLGEQGDTVTLHLACRRSDGRAALQVWHRAAGGEGQGGLGQCGEQSWGISWY